MKKLYWRASKVPSNALLFTSVVALSFIAVIEINKIEQQQPYYQEKIQAAKLMKDAMEQIKEFRIEKYGPLDVNLDPAQSGMIGLTSSHITSSLGYLNVKQTTINPNWAAAMVMMLKEAGLKQGDYVAIGTSGSFPALSIASLAAVEVLGLNPITISSVAASNWGANITDFTWLDMEKLLFDAGLFSHRSVAASLGGDEDLALGLPSEGIALIIDAIKRAKIRQLHAKNLTESINSRMAAYKEYSKGKPIAAYINIGGGEASTGSREAKRIFQPGLNKKNPAKARKLDGVMERFSSMGVPVIHLSYIDKLAAIYGLSLAPTQMPNIGEGELYGSITYNRPLAGGLLLSLLVLMYMLLRMDIGYRIFGSLRAASPIRPPEPMV